MILHIIIIFLPFVRKSLYIVYSIWTHSDILASSTANHLCMMMVILTDGIIRFRSIRTDTDGRTYFKWHLASIKTHYTLPSVKQQWRAQHLPLCCGLRRLPDSAASSRRLRPRLATESRRLPVTTAVAAVCSAVVGPRRRPSGQAWV